MATVAGLDELAALSPAELEALYERASTPVFADVHGDLVGRMLAIPGLRTGFIARALRAFAAWRRFPWRGKSFATARAGGPTRPGEGEGINRVFGGARRWYRFETSIGPSRAGAFDAFQLDYDNPGNPFFIRAIKDEIRQVRPGLFLGQAYLLVRKRARLVLYFALAQPSG